MKMAERLGRKPIILLPFHFSAIPRFPGRGVLPAPPAPRLVENRVVVFANSVFNGASMNYVRRFTTRSVCFVLWLSLVIGQGQSMAVDAFRPEKLAEIDAAINQAIADKKCPGGVF